MEKEEIELFLKCKIENLRWRPGLYYDLINKYAVYTDYNQYSFYIVHLPYDYYLLLPFTKFSLSLLKTNCWRYDGFGIVGLNNFYLYNNEK